MFVWDAQKLVVLFYSWHHFWCIPNEYGPSYFVSRPVCQCFIVNYQFQIFKNETLFQKIAKTYSKNIR